MSSDSHACGVCWRLILIPGDQGGRFFAGARVFAADRKTGQPLWVTQVGPGGITGGLQWGAATDGTRIYVGAILRDFVSGGACQAGAAIAGGTAYWGSGYQTAFGLTPNNKLFALSPQ